MAEITTFGGKVLPLDTDTAPDAAVGVLLRRVGERVRHIRERKGIPRRVLSELSGVSPRYLAQLESGEGNISIGLLERVAMALDHRIEWLVGTDDPWSSDALKVAELYRTADRNTRQTVMDVLADGGTATNRASRVCLVGLRGAGKTTLGRLAGDKLDAPFVELNREIEDHAGMPVGEVIAFYGHEGYRRLESDALDRVVATYDRAILAVAGGIVSEPATYSKLLARFHAVWLKASPVEHMERVRAQGDERPMAGNPEAMDQLRSILTSREVLYDRAQATIDTSGATVQESLAALVSVILKRNFLS